MTPKKPHRPTAEERDERVKVDMPADKFVKGVMEAVPHPDEDVSEDDETDSAR